MLSIPPSVRIFLAVEPADMRKSFDGLSALVEGVIQASPYCGHLFVFRNRRGDRMKILMWDRSGFWIFYKRLEKGSFRFPSGPEASVEVEAADLMLLLEGIELAGVRRRPRWTPPAGHGPEIRSPRGV